MKSKIRRNIKLFPYFNFFRKFRPIMPVMWIYISGKVGSYTVAMSYISFLTVLIALLEIPTGILSDKIGRKWTMILASFLRCGESLFYIVADGASMLNFYILYMLAGFCNGFALATFSGADNALLYETMSNLKKKKKYHNVFGKFTSMIHFALALSSLIGGVVATKSFVLVFYINLLAQVITLLISLFFVEPKIKEEEKSKDNSIKHFLKAFRAIRKNKTLRFLSIGTVLERGFGKISYEFRQVFFAQLVPTSVIGLTRFLRHVSGGISRWYSGKIVDKFGVYKAVVGGTLLAKIIGLSATLLSSFLTPFIFLTTSFIKSPSNIAREKIFQTEFSKNQRATMGSIVSFFDNIIMALGAVSVGLFADFTSPKFAVFIFISLSTLGTWFYHKAIKNIES